MSIDNIHLHITFSENCINLLKADKTLADKFFYCLRNSTIFEKFAVTCDINQEIFPFTNQQVSHEAATATHILRFKRIALFAPFTIEEMLRSAIYWDSSVIIPNTYDSNHAIFPLSNNGSTHTNFIYTAPFILHPASIQTLHLCNVRLQTNANCFTSLPASKKPSCIPSVTTIIRFHKNADFKLLRNALGCLAAMQNCFVTPLIAAQDLTDKQTLELESLLGEFKWSTESTPVIQHYYSRNNNGDLRSKMLNESLRHVKTKYAAFLDYDDLIMPHAYDWLIDRLTATGKAVAFGRVYCTSFDNAKMLCIDRSSLYEYGYSYEDFIDHNHAPLHSFLIDTTQFNFDNIEYDENQKYMEDYFLTLQLFTKENTDWNSLKENRYIGDYIHSIDRQHTLAFSEDSIRAKLLKDEKYLACDKKINELRKRINKTAN